MKPLALAAVIPTLLAAPAVAAASSTHQVEQGESLWTISRHYGCDVEALKRANGLDDSTIFAGQSLRVPRCGEGGDDSGGSENAGGQTAAVETAAAAPQTGSVVRYTVVSGDTLGTIAKGHDTTVEDIKSRNGLRGDLIRAGQSLRIVPGGSLGPVAVAGQSVGRPQAGRLVGGIRLPPDKAYHRRRPHRAWGANHAVEHIRRAVSSVRRHFPRIHVLAIGDLSARRGGRITMHRSHQSGRDADVGLYFKKRPRGYPNSFVKGTAGNLHFAATWRLLEAFAETADDPGGVERIFISYGLQKLIYDWARANGVAADVLDRTFQYPHGRTNLRGIVRHEPGHDAHMHIRFKCPPDDDGCK